jgi:hypothetical protein
LVALFGGEITVIFFDELGDLLEGRRLLTNSSFYHSRARTFEFARLKSL